LQGRSLKKQHQKISVLPKTATLELQATHGPQRFARELSGRSGISSHCQTHGWPRGFAGGTRAVPSPNPLAARKAIRTTWMSGRVGGRGRQTEVRLKTPSFNTVKHIHAKNSQNTFTIHALASCLTSHQCTSSLATESPALNNKNDSLLIRRYLILPTTSRQGQKVKSTNTVSQRSLSGGIKPSGAAQAGFPRGPRSCSRCRQRMESPTTPRSKPSQHRHTTPRSPHSEVAFMWKAGASQHAARKWDCRRGRYIQFNLFW